MSPANKKLARTVKLRCRREHAGVSHTSSYVRYKIPGRGSVYYQNLGTMIRVTTTSTEARKLVQEVLGRTPVRDAKGYHTWALR